MIRSFVFSEGKLVASDLEAEAMRLVRADKGLHLWVDLDQPTAEEIKLVLESVFQFHPLTIEDCIAPTSLPKVEDYEDYLFIVTHAVDLAQTEKFTTTELDLYLGKEFLVTFHRKPLRSIEWLVERCNKATGVIARGPDRLAHDVLDQLIDRYTPVLDGLRAKIELLEARVLKEHAENLTADLLAIRADLADLRQIVRPQRDVINRLAHGDTKIVRTIMLPYFRDLRDKLIRQEETLTTLGDALLVSFDLYLNKSASQANEGIKVLTALTAITMPPILFGTWYGMNFEHMPELSSPYGYWISLGVMLTATLGMFLWCRRRGWI
ncbi:MAG TPA: magnesium/cobalt transporter CorA [Opitutaceae bacterium]|nr:magnesium/cobalt transporter CorA [Opitutaceae bacterium]